MVLGSIYVVFIADDFIGPFQAFLITVGVPIAAWAGVFVADLALRRSDYADLELYDPRGRYGAISWAAVLVVVLGTFLGLGPGDDHGAGPALAVLAGLPARAVRHGLARPTAPGPTPTSVSSSRSRSASSAGWLLGRSVVRRQEAAGVSA